jgi:type IV pilus assembly protein PilC
VTEAMRRLEGFGDQPGDRQAKTPWWQIQITRPVKTEELMNFSRQCASFLRAGIPVLDALAVIAEDARKHMKATLEDMGVALRSGASFGGAVARHPDVFPPHYVSMVRSAELTGRLDDVLDQLAVYAGRDLDARRKVKSAITYPLVICVVAIITVIVLSTYVLPQFRRFFRELNAQLPAATRALLAATSFLGTWWWAILGSMLGLGVLTLAFVRSEAGRKRFDQFLLRLPVIGGLVRYVIVERFCRILAAMVAAGVALPDALSVAIGSANNRVFQEGLADAREDMIQGAGLARPIADSGLFPAAANQMIRVGETTGTLDSQLESAAQYFERELDYRLKRFTDLFEPAVIIVMGLIVGFVAIALVTAMYGIFRQVNVQ